MLPILEKLTGTAAMTDQIIASDLLIACKSGVRNYAIALTEATSSDVRQILRKHLEDAISAQELVFNYMAEKGWYDAYDVSKQTTVEIQNANVALALPQ